MDDPASFRFHRLVPPLIGAMAVVRYQVFWYARSAQSGPAGRCLPDVDEFEKATYERPGFFDATRPNPFKKFKFSRAQPNRRMKYIYVWWNGMLVHVRIQWHNEYFVILTSINFSRDMLKCKIDSEDIRDHRKYSKDSRHCRAKIEECISSLRPASSVARESTKKLLEKSKIDSLNYLLGPLNTAKPEKNILAQFDDDFDMDELRRKASPAPGMDSGMIIDLRGLVTSSPSERRQGPIAKVFRRSRRLFRQCFTDAALPVRADGYLLAKADKKAIENEADVLSKSGRDSWYLHEIGRYWRAVQPDAVVEHSEAIEFSATGLLDGKALFITHMALPPNEQADAELAPTGPVPSDCEDSAAGAVPPDGAASAEAPAAGAQAGAEESPAAPGADDPKTSTADTVPPIRFFLHCRRSDERQIGRVVDRLCTMATVRAALERHASQILDKRPDLRELLGSIEKSMRGLIAQNGILTSIILKQDDGQGAIRREEAKPKPDEGGDGSPGEADAKPGGGKGASQEEGGEATGAEGSAPPSKAPSPPPPSEDAAIDYFASGPDSPPPKDQSTRDVLRALASGMNKLEQDVQDKLQHASGTAPNDRGSADDYMEYRVERANYYFNKFSRLSEHMRVARVEGFQTYPELVQRRMQDALSYVQNAKEYLREIADQRTRMSVQIANITQIVEAHESDEEQRKIADIQDFAEFALLTFLLPYYLGYILKDALYKMEWYNTSKITLFTLIIIFTVINLFKRWVDDKLTISYWIPKKKTYVRRCLATLSSINVLSSLAILFSIIFIFALLDSKHEPATEGAKQVECQALCRALSNGTGAGTEVANGTE